MTTLPGNPVIPFRFQPNLDVESVLHDTEKKEVKFLESTSSEDYEKNAFMLGKKRAYRLCVLMS